VSVIMAELYDALRLAGVEDDKAKAAAGAVIPAESRQDLATKADLAQLESRLIRWNVGTIIAITAVFAAIVKLL
jgi:hypothetical protein